MEKLISWILVIPIHIYRYLISPWLPNSCRHVPTCSAYALEAIKEHGPFVGFWLGFKRVLKCHPWGTHGYDPVPPKKKKKK
ncbi:MAG: membrane protein insertion efficiency factor YidD [Salinivirgaceae bacterium]|nr:membrane protein insertion efficiency factor YidD [Salinivirgaceae bacterium]